MFTMNDKIMRPAGYGYGMVWYFVDYFTLYVYFVVI